MKKLIALLLFTLNVLSAQGGNEKVLFIVDDIPVIEDPGEEFGTLTEEEVHKIQVIEDQAKIAELGYDNVDKVIYVYTVEFANRPDSIKAIPSTRIMHKIEGTWFYLDENTPYSGPFIDYYYNGKIQGEGFLVDGKLKGPRIIYHRNGNISDEIEYDKGVSNGIEKRYYEDGTLMQIGELNTGKEIGEWRLYHPNGELKQYAKFIDGVAVGEIITYYSTGKLKEKTALVNGRPQQSKDQQKLVKTYNQSQQLYQQLDFKGAIKKLDKVIELNPEWIDGYFARGTAKLNNFQFEAAIEDLSKAIEIEPLDARSYANRAFALMRKYQMGNNLAQSKEVLVLSGSKSDIPEEELIKICNDLQKAVSLGDDTAMVLDALKDYCE